MTTAQAEKKIRATISRFWHDRALEMLRHLTTSTITHTTVSGLYAHKDWPFKGTIRFTRDADGARFELYVTGSAFKSRRLN